MFYIKLDGKSMDLTVTVREAIYRGDNLCRKVIYLLPLAIGELNVESCCVYLNYVRADGVADVALLEKLPEKYNESYLQYTFPIGCKITKYAGPVCTWIHFYTGDPSFPISTKSGECVLQIQASRSIDEYTCDHQMTAIYQMQKKIEESGGLGGGVDGLVYDEETRELKLVRGDEAVGDSVTVPGDDYAPKQEDLWEEMDAMDNLEDPNDRETPNDDIYWEAM